MLLLADLNCVPVCPAPRGEEQGMREIQAVSSSVPLLPATAQARAHVAKQYPLPSPSNAQATALEVLHLPVPLPSPSQGAARFSAIFVHSGNILL